jgi:hypothetical protein
MQSAQGVHLRRMSRRLASSACQSKESDHDERRRARSKKRLARSGSTAFHQRLSTYSAGDDDAIDDGEDVANAVGCDSAADQSRQRGRGFDGPDVVETGSVVGRDDGVGVKEFEVATSSAIVPSPSVRTRSATRFARIRSPTASAPIAATRRTSCLQRPRTTA